MCKKQGELKRLAFQFRNRLADALLNDDGSKRGEEVGSTSGKTGIRLKEANVVFNSSFI